MQSNVPYSLTRNPAPQIQRSQFNRSSSYKTTFDAGYLIPIYLDEVLPGDTFNMQATCFARLATPIFPIMDNMFFDTQWFFVPKRLLWKNFKKMMGEVPVQGSDNPNNYTVPVFDRATYPALGFAEGTIYDYLGLPIGIVPGGGMVLDLTSLPLRAYNLCYNEWYMDQSLQTPVFFTDDDATADDYADFALLRRGKRKDYFTSATIYPQKLWSGDSAPLIPVSSTYAGANVESVTSATNAGKIRRSSSGALYGSSTGLGSDANSSFENVSSGVDLFYDPNGTLFVAPDQDMMGTINELRVAVQMQRFLEKDNRGGTRYPEFVWNHFGVIAPDILWRPEYLGGSSDMIKITPVQQTSETSTTPQGNLAAQGTMLAQPRWVKSFNEHGYVLGIASVRADLSYQQNVDRLWFARSNRYDFYLPEFAHVGDQPVYSLEIFASTTNWGNNRPVLGYQERYAEYKFKNSLITGAFRSQAATSLDAWHLAQEFTASPTLGDTFIVENPPVDRIIATPAEPQFIMDCYFKLICARPMPTYSTPGMMDHF